MFETILTFICAGLCLIIGIIAFANPYILWYLKHGIRSNGGEPSELFEHEAKVIGVLAFIGFFIFLGMAIHSL